MTFWQPLISHAALSCFNRTGQVPTFQLAEGDMIDLVAQITDREPESIRDDIAQVEGYLTMRCMVKCEALGRAIRVDLWHRQ